MPRLNIPNAHVVCFTRESDWGKMQTNEFISSVKDA